MKLASSRTLPGQFRAESSAYPSGEISRSGAPAEAALARKWRRGLGQVLAALAQRRHADGDDREAEVQVFPEAAGRYLGPDVLVGGGDDADVDGDGLLAAEALEPSSPGARAGLWPGRAARGRRSRRGRACRRPRLEPACAPVTASVKAPFSWPKSSLSRRRIGDGGAVDFDEGPLGPSALGMEDPAISSLPVPFSPVIRIRASLGAACSMRARTSDHRGDDPISGSIDGRGGDALEVAILPPKLPDLEGVARGRKETIHRKRLLDEVEGPELEGADSHVDRTVARND